MWVMFVHFLLAGLGTVLSNPTVYDQRQTGKTNIRVEVKDAVIIAVGDGESGGDYDYNYDYSDLTIKPSQPVSSTSSLPPTASTTQKPSTTSTAKPVFSSPAANHSITQNSGVVLEAENNSIIFPSNKPENGSTNPIKITPTSYKPDQIPVLVVQESQGSRPNKFLPVKTVEKNYVPSSRLRAKSSNETAFNPEDLPARHCSPGFFLDNHNRCKRIRRPVRERPHSANRP